MIALLFLFLVSAAPVIVPQPAVAGLPRTTKSSPEQSAIQYLSREVSAWKPDNNCYSCHNNGDAARALYRAKRLKYRVEKKPVLDTTRWLINPDQWEKNGGKGPFRDKQLAELQFSYALSEAVLSGDVKDRKPLLRGAKKVVARQQKDGSWKLDENQVIGSPATYGRVLGTVIAREVLFQADPKHFYQPIQKAEQFLLKQRPQTVLDAAAVLLFAGSLDGKKTKELQKHCLQVIRKGEDPDGGWGPYVNSVAEPFDTALVLLSLSRLSEKAKVAELIQRGRNHLIKEQLADGSWLETTRPANSESYAQRLSTTGWALMGLMATRNASH